MFRIHQRRHLNKYWQRFFCEAQMWWNVTMLCLPSGFHSVSVVKRSCFGWRKWQELSRLPVKCDRVLLPHTWLEIVPSSPQEKFQRCHAYKRFRCRGPPSTISGGFPLTNAWNAVSKLQPSRLRLHHHPLHHQVWTHNVTVMWHVSWKCHYGDIWHMQRVAGLNRRYLARIPGWTWVMATTVETWRECPFIWYPTFL